MSVSKVSKSQCSVSGDALLTTSYGDDGVVQGKAFVFDRNFTIGTGATLYILLDYTTYKPNPDQAGLIYILPPIFTTSAGPVKVQIYRETNYSGGTKIPAYNPNTTALKTSSATTITSGATGSDKGTLALEYLVGGDSQGNNSANGSASGLAFYIRKNTGKTLVEVVNLAGKEITFNNSQLLYEI